MTEKNTASVSNGNGVFWTFLLVVLVSTGIGLMGWKWFFKGANHPRPKGGEPFATASKPGENDGFVPLIVQDGDSSSSHDAPPLFQPEGEGLGRVIPFSLTNQDGKEFSLDALKSKIWIADFIFTRCGSTCPGMSAEMSRLRSDLKEIPNIYYISFSVDPKNDTPQALAEYSKQFGGAGDHWYYLTGDRQIIFDVALTSFKVGMDLMNPKDPTSILHSSKFFLIDGAGVIRGRYDSAERGDMKQLRENARQLAGAKK
ncbi:MAG: SCO family protein [Planctomycetes bacterium]|nr:SCO family protein [Planctomycetota bacterium]